MLQYFRLTERLREEAKKLYIVETTCTCRDDV